MQQPYKIAIAGIGGVGGFYGAHLASTYQNSTEVSVSFIARGAHMQAIKQNGLLLEKNSGNITAHPHHITDNPAELGPLDLILFCCKGYDLQAFATAFAPCITPNTILLPTLNGVVATETLQSIYPNAHILYGCTYQVTKLAGPGTVKMIGDLNQLFFGNPAVPQSELQKIEALFCATGVNASAQTDIIMKAWEKFSFIAPIATATSALNSTIDAILSDDAKKAVLTNLMHETVTLAEAKNITLPQNVIEANMEKAAKTPAGATSSMHNDFMAHKNTELEMLTGYVVRQAHQHDLDLPTYNELYAVLKEKVFS